MDVSLRLVLVALWVVPQTSGADGGGRLGAENLSELVICRDRVLVALDAQTDTLRDVLHAGAIGVLEGAQPRAEDVRLGMVRGLVDAGADALDQLGSQSLMPSMNNGGLPRSFSWNARNEMKPSGLAWRNSTLTKVATSCALAALIAQILNVNDGRRLGGLLRTVVFCDM